MAFYKLPSNSRKLLNEIVIAKNPATMLKERLMGITQVEGDELRGIIRELKELGYIDIRWADNLPYCVTVNNSARTYEEQLKEYEKDNGAKVLKTTPNEKIFISHRSSDCAVADALFDFFVATGIPRDKIFCSSLPGNDVHMKISVEVKENLQNSCLNIAILSNDYYKSAYCLNEAGILWFENIPIILIALPEINHENMIGFLDNDNKIRHLDNTNDIAFIYDTACESVKIRQTKASVVSAESQKLIKKYQQVLSNRIQPQEESPKDINVTTDDERIVLYYLCSKKVRKVSKEAILDWVQDKEISGFNVDNAFDLLSTIGTAKLENDTLELGIKEFRTMTSTPDNLSEDLQSAVNAHINLSSDRFQKLWKENRFDDDTKLFVAYIVDEHIEKLGDRWMAEGQRNHIEKWEGKNSLSSSLSINYGKCLSFFIQNGFVVGSDWTSCGNPREYRLCTSLKELLFSHSNIFSDELQSIKDKYYFDIPF